MLILKQIKITHFKNYGIRQFDFNEKVTGICGLNGQGKTNLLDAIYYSCFTKSYFSHSDSLVIGFGKDGFRLESTFLKDNAEQQLVFVHRGIKKELTVNNIPYEKLSGHIGQFPAVMVAPDDVEIITGVSEERRRWLNALICQLNPEYLQQLMRYNKILQQRNSLLKAFATQTTPDFSLLDVLDRQLCEPALYVFEQRKNIMKDIEPLVQQFYKKLSGSHEAVSCIYETQLSVEAYAQLLLTMRKRDCLLQRTDAGVHKDDLNFKFGEWSFKSVASQGQRKTLLFALKLSEYELLKRYKGFPPLLLLDDIFEKLDDNRMNNLMQFVCKENDGQVFVTDTHCNRLQQTLTGIGIQGSLIAL